MLFASRIGQGCGATMRPASFKSNVLSARTRNLVTKGTAAEQPGGQSARSWIDAWHASQKQSKLTLWKLCIKPPMYTVGLAPMLVGAAMAYASTGQFNGETLMRMLLGSILVIAWLNTSNDAFDSLTGVDDDRTKPESIVNLTRLDWRALLAASMAMLGTGIWSMAGPLLQCGSHLPAQLLAAAIACGYIYQGPPFRLSYKGLGEPLCFVAFGPLATTAAYLVHALPAAAATSAQALLQASAALIAPATVALGLSTASVLFCSHFHQIKGDIAACKMSPLVRLGTKQGSQVLYGICAATHAIACLGLLFAANMPQEAPLGLLALPFAFSMCKFATANHTIDAKIKPLKLYAIKWHTSLALALVLAYVTAGVRMHGAESLLAGAVAS